MLRITVNRSASGAKKYYSEAYYSEGNSKQDYYSEKDQVMGVWGGKAANKLNLNGDMNKNDFASLCDNLTPGTNSKLTERHNAERRVGYDFTFNANKSVSLAYTFGNEEDKKQLLQAFHESVKETMSEIETGMQARVRVKGQNENRETGNIVYGMFTHFTSRPVDNIPDPHLHAHCFVFNSTYDDKEGKWKAGEFGQIKTDAPYYEVVFHSSLAKKLQLLGYEVENSKKGFEIKGISRETIEKFSWRTEEIEHLALEKNITNEETKAQLGAMTRESKRESITEVEQKAHWDARLTNKEKEDLKNLKSNGWSEGEKKEYPHSAYNAVDFSIRHHLERKSVTTDKEILTTAIKSSLGQVIPDEVKSVFNQNKSIISVKENNQTFITTKEALYEENDLIARAHKTKGVFKPINENYQIKDANLSEEQCQAISEVLNSNNGITIISGKAGTGKTTLMKEVWSGVKESGKEIFAFAPSAEASRVVQRKEGFENAETLALLFQSKELQAKMKNSVVWIDEAGMISNRDMNKVLTIAKEQNARLVLTGDINQHKSIERGDALRILQQEADITPIHVTKIRRQKDAQYKQAVDYLAKGNVEKGFNKLDKNGSIHEIENDKERIAKIAEDYFSSTFIKNKESKEVLVISPTHGEADKVTESIRQKLKIEEVLTGYEKKVVAYKNLQLTAAEKGNTENYVKGNWVIFHQNAKGFKAGSKYEIIEQIEGKILVKNGLRVSSLPLEQLKRYNVFESKSISISKGDKILITGNGKSVDGKHLFNGSLFNVKGFDKRGNIKLSNGSTLSSDYGHIAHGYVMTSHASQGKTVDKVIISQSVMSFRAASKEQFYVSVSRGRLGISIYTDDKTDLLHAVSQSSERKSAVELTKQKLIQAKIIDINRRSTFNKVKEIALETVQKFMSIGNR